MLVVPVLRLIMLALLLTILIDGATHLGLYNNWKFLLWDKKPDLPSGFFDLLRVVLSLCLAWDAWTHTRYARLGFLGSMGWTVLLALLLVLYQPIFPVQFSYHVWLWVDLIAFSILAVHTWIVSRPLFDLLGSMVMQGENPLGTPQHKVIAAIFLGYANAASFMVSSTEYLSEERKKPTERPEQDGAHKGKSENAQYPSEGPLHSPSICRPSDPPGAIIDRRTLDDQISDLENIKSQLDGRKATPNLSEAKQMQRISRLETMVSQMDEAMADPNLSPQKREAAKRVKAGAQHLLAQRKQRMLKSRP